MTGKTLWQNLKFLVECDRHISNTEKEIALAKQTLISEQGQIAQLKTNVEEQKYAIIQEQKNIDFYELKAQTIQEEETHKRKNLENIKHQKEYTAFVKELEQLTEQRKEVDDLLVRAYYQMDATKKKHADEKIAAEQKIVQINNDTLSNQEKITQLSQQLVHWQEEYQKALAAIPAEWLVRYERMRHSVTDPIVPVLNDACSACYYTILHQDLIKLKKSGILLCRNCYRFLYYDSEEEKDTKKASY